MRSDRKSNGRIDGIEEELKLGFWWREEKRKREGKCSWKLGREERGEKKEPKNCSFGGRRWRFGCGEGEAGGEGRKKKKRFGLGEEEKEREKGRDATEINICNRWDGCIIVGTISVILAWKRVIVRRLHKRWERLCSVEIGNWFGLIVTTVA